MYPQILLIISHFMSPSDGQTLLKELQPHCNDINITSNGTGVLVYNLTNENN